ncbi:transcription factor bHLH95-like [Olea europaea var. sylvestris]|uniref:transcription factor bHLH95-like n=1 Tax=Olea europaea var. sylvestris TaxID=158386 RepID=UPI000C1D820C|nr:transcription factor bHLH95-like [Olea europaea var. sylvestris]
MSKDDNHGKFSFDNRSQNSDNLGGDEEESGKKNGRDTESSPPPATGKKRVAADKDGGDQLNEESGGYDLDHEVHTWTERERRKKMRDMFANLQAFLPQLPPKTDKSTIVDEAVNHIRMLQKTIQKLEKQKHEKLATKAGEAVLADEGSSKNNLPSINASNSFSFSQIPVFFQTWSSPNMSLNICGQDAQISICCPKKAGLFTAICYVLEKHKIEVVSAQVSSDHHRSMYMIQAHAIGVSNKVQEPFPVEEIYKKAAEEIMLIVNS